MRSGKPQELVLLSVVIALAAGAVAIRAAGDIRNAARGMDFIHDDAYYYSTVARNLATTGRMSFDGISRTNGYHPLWFWLQVLMFKAGAARLSVAGQTVAIMVLQWIILAISFLLLLRWTYKNRLEHPEAAASVLMGVVLLAYPNHISLFALGMESTLILPLVALFLLLVWRSRWKAAGVAALLLTMSRLDCLVYVVFPTAIYAALARRDSLAAALKRGLAVVAPASAGTAALMTAYALSFGHVMPIHGALRSTFPAINFQPHLFSYPIALAKAAGRPWALAKFGLPTSSVVLPLCGLVLLRAGNLPRAVRRGAMLLVVLGLIQLAAFLLFQKWSKPISGWYLAQLLIFSSGAAAAATVNLIGVRRAQYLCLVLALGVAGLSVVREYTRLEAPVSNNELYAFVESRPAGTVWAATDCGSVAFRTGAAFINLDGLVNDFEYQAALKHHGLGRYLQQAGVDYLLVGAWETPPVQGPVEPMYVHRIDPALYRGDYATYKFFVYSYLYGCYSDTITLSSAQEVWRSAPEMDATIPARTVIFRLNKHSPDSTTTTSPVGADPP